MTERIRLSRVQRRSMIVTTAVRIANRNGLGAVTFQLVADRCRIRTERWTVKNHFPTKADLLRAVCHDDNVSEDVIRAGKDLGLFGLKDK